LQRQRSDQEFTDEREKEKERKREEENLKYVRGPGPFSNLKSDGPDRSSPPASGSPPLDSPSSKRLFPFPGAGPRTTKEEEKHSFTERPF
jgi:hypothetical protein